MHNRIIVTAGICLLSVFCLARAEEAIEFLPNNGDPVKAFKGVLLVPENRNNPGSRKIPLNYVRFPATTDAPGSPIVYLSGGPGGSGIETAKRARFPLFMAMRAYGDVIALDQRGTGREHDTPRCESSSRQPLDVVLSDAEFIALRRVALAECLEFWRTAGIDIYGYTTPQSVADLEDLRRHLGAERLSLWGISYGTHLALAAMKSMSDQLDRVILATVEGLDQTIKLPARTDEYFDRLQAAINTSEELRKRFPDIKAMIRRVHAALDKKPIKLRIPQGEHHIDLLFGRRDMQQIAASSISDPQRALRLLQLYQAVEHGVAEPLVEVIQRYGDVSKPISFHAMSTMMDLASGQTEARYDLVLEQAKTSLLGSQLNRSIHLTGVVPALDLGDEFRQAPKSDVPTLVLRGTLDGRIYPDSQLEATAGLSKRTAVTVVNAGHNLFMTSPAVGEVMGRFMRGDVIQDESIIRVDLPW